jgi:acylphosphatase
MENKYYDFSDYNMVPWFTLDEDYCKLEFFEDPEYSKKLVEATRQYKYNPTLENCTKVLNLGWNPSVELTKESIEYAKKRQIEYLKEHSSIIYDLTKFNNDSLLTESSSAMKAIYKQLNIYPVYIVLSWTNTNFGKIIRFVKNSKYTHAGLSLDSSLNEIVTFKYDSISNGFEIENLKGYINTYRDCQIEVLCLFVDKTTLKKLKESIDFYKKAINVTKYGFKNLFNILLNRKKEYTPYDTEMVCSQFVDQILKLCDIDITGKANNLVIPQDYVTIASANPKIYKIFEGYGKDYIDGKVEANIKDLIDKNGDKIRYKEEAYNLEEGINIPLEYALYSVEK